MDDLQRERDYYRDQCDELGARLFHVCKELVTVRHDERRARTAIILVRKIYELLNPDITMEELGKRFLQVILSSMWADCAMVLRYDRADGCFITQHLLGFDQPVKELFRIAQPIPAFLFISSKTESDIQVDALRKFIEQPYCIWAYNQYEDIALLIGNDTEDRGFRLPFGQEDREIVECSLSVYVDILSHRKMEEGLLKARKVESLGLLAGGIAHDFNNILSAILGNVNLAMMCMDSREELTEILQDIEAASVQAKGLTHKLLTFSKGGAPIKKTASIAEIIVDSAGFTMSGSKVRCEYDLPVDLWPVETDEVQISQVIQNLTINACQAMPEGGVLKIAAENVPAAVTDNAAAGVDPCVKLTFQDQGTGISRENLQKIFDPYFSTKEKGSGLGLATAFSIITKHGGQISVESEVGKGTTFSIVLPASTANVPITLEKDKDKDKDTRVLAGCGKVLIMDDEDKVRRVACRILTRIGYEPVEVSDGTEAIELYREATDSGTPFVAVIMDLTIPGGMGGKEAVQQILAMDPEATVIVFSGYSNDSVMANYKEYGFKGVVTKPFSAESLSEGLYQALRYVSKALVEKTDKMQPPDNEMFMDERDHHILVVDDEQFIARVTQRQLENYGYTVTCTGDSQEALTIFRSTPGRFDLLVTDQTMPGLSGIELARAVKELKPDMPVILCTGHSNFVSKEESQAIGIKRYIYKPIVGNELLTAVQSVLAEQTNKNQCQGNQGDGSDPAGPL